MHNYSYNVTLGGQLCMLCILTSKCMLAHVLAWLKTMKNIQKSLKKNLNVFYRFRPCECMHKHDFAGRNTQHLYFYVLRTVL